MEQEFPDETEFETSQLAYELDRRSVSYDTLVMMPFSDFAERVEIGSLERVLGRYQNQELPVVAVINCADRTSREVFVEHEMLAIGSYLCIEKQAFERLQFNGLSLDQRKSLGKSIMDALSPTSVTAH